MSTIIKPRNDLRGFLSSYSAVRSLRLRTIYVLPELSSASLTHNYVYHN